MNKTSEKSLNEIQLYFQKNGYKADIQGNYVEVQEEFKIKNQYGLQSFVKPCKINKMKNAEIFVRGRK